MVLNFRVKDISVSRLDPWHYKPEFQKSIAQIKKSGSCKTVSTIIDQKRGIKGGATPLGADYLKEGKVRFYRTSCVKDLAIDLSQAVFISDEQDQELLRSRLSFNDIILTITGVYFGQSAVVLEKHLPGNISQHSVRFQPQSVDSHYLVAYLNCYYGQSVIWKHAYGATRPAIDYPSIQDLIVRVPHPLAQSYIGDKVRQAERLRERAQYLIKQAQKKFINLFSDYKTDLFVGAAGRINYRQILQKPLCQNISCEDIQDRLDTRLYNPYFFETIHYIKNKNKYIQLKDAINYMGTGISGLEYTDKGLQVILTKDITSDGISKNLRQISTIAPETELTALDDCLLTTYGGPSIGKVGIARGWAVGCSYDYTILRLKANGTDVKPGFLFLLLQSALFQHQLAANIKGTTGITFTLSSDIQNFLIPLVSENEQLEIEQLCYQAVDAKQNSIGLTDAAKLLVEALIEGKISENELKEAQEALQNKDNSKDKAILARLTRDGFVDGEEERAGRSRSHVLFPDLEALYEAIEK